MTAKKLYDTQAQVINLEFFANLIFGKDIDLYQMFQETRKGSRMTLVMKDGQYILKFYKTTASTTPSIPWGTLVDFELAFDGDTEIRKMFTTFLEKKMTLEYLYNKIYDEEGNPFNDEDLSTDYLCQIANDEDFTEMIPATDGFVIGMTKTRDGNIIVEGNEGSFSKKFAPDTKVGEVIKHLYNGMVEQWNAIIEEEETKAREEEE